MVWYGVWLLLYAGRSMLYAEVRAVRIMCWRNLIKPRLALVPGICLMSTFQTLLMKHTRRCDIIDVCIRVSRACALSWYASRHVLQFNRRSIAGRSRAAAGCQQLSDRNCGSHALSDYSDDSICQM